MMEMTMQWARWGGGLGVMLATALMAVASAAVAAQGDALLVTGSNVNVRAGPSTDAGILARVGIDEPATELRRLGEWVEVTLPAQDVLGWIHGSLLAAVPAPVAGAATEAIPAPAAGTATEAIPAPAPADTAPLAVAVVESTHAAATPPAAQAAEPSTPAVRVAAVPGAAARAAEPAATTALGRFRSDVEHFNDRAIAAAGVDLFTGVKPLGEGGVQVVTTEAWAIMSQPGQQSYLNALFGRWQAATGGAKGLRLEIVDSAGALMMERTQP
jgi:Bacterial SH3 domain